MSDIVTILPMTSRQLRGRNRRRNAVALAILLSGTVATAVVADQRTPTHKQQADAMFECSSRGMEAWVAGDDQLAIVWLQETNLAGITGRCRDHVMVIRDSVTGEDLPVIVE